MAEQPTADKCAGTGARLVHGRTTSSWQMCKHLRKTNVSQNNQQLTNAQGTDARLAHGKNNQRLTNTQASAQD